MHRITVFVPAVLAILSIAPAPAQNLTPQQKISYLQVATTAAREQLEAGATDQARLCQLAVLTPLQGLLPARQQEPVKGLIDDYMKVQGKAWQGAPSQLTQQGLGAFLDFFEKNKPRLMALTKAFNLEQGSLPNGTQEYYRCIADVLAQRKQAYELAGQWAMAAPRPELLLAQDVFMHLFGKDIPKALYHITFGPATAAGHAQQRVLPENVEMIEAALRTAANSEDHRVIYEQLTRAKEAVTIIETVEAALRGEVDVSGLTARVPQLKQQMIALQEKADRLFDQMVDENRMPGHMTWRGGDAEEAELRAQIEASWNSLFPRERVLTIHFRSSDFATRWESGWEGDTLYSSLFGYILVAVAAEQPDGKCRVFLKFFRRPSNQDGSWSELEMHSTESSYLMCKENL
ncbi:MAG: hypothetical protein V2A76_11160 [Planctomycetota bacterium]